MAATAFVQAKVNPELKRQAERDLKAWGLDMSTAIRMFLTNLVETRHLPFVVGDYKEFDPYYEWEAKAVADWEASDQKSYSPAEARKRLGLD
ncbi:MAG: type II toxin-antitoxin system RelB/DinJ family antitoxin [Coriobacteriales bacterium]|jgi:addiction module RelB/DinJ family antitoxin|nr:type II toxin-antitoxin system RelB/DinJ family antitoxin [Coriobacteriales bacterium]